MRVSRHLALMDDSTQNTRSTFFIPRTTPIANHHERDWVRHTRISRLIDRCNQIIADDFLEAGGERGGDHMEEGWEPPLPWAPPFPANLLQPGQQPPEDIAGPSMPESLQEAPIPRQRKKLPMPIQRQLEQRTNGHSHNNSNSRHNNSNSNSQATAT